MRGDAPLLAAAAGGLGASLVALAAGSRVSPVVTEALRAAAPVSLAAGLSTLGLLLATLPRGASSVASAVASRGSRPRPASHVAKSTAAPTAAGLAALGTSKTRMD